MRYAHAHTHTHSTWYILERMAGTESRLGLLRNRILERVPHCSLTSKSHLDDALWSIRLRHAERQFGAAQHSQDWLVVYSITSSIPCKQSIRDSLAPEI